MTLLSPITSPTALASHEDCRLLVDTFYARVREDAMLGPVFASRIADDAWPAHLERMAGFWYTVLFGVPLYHGDPRVKHGGLPLTWSHFERWLALWSSTLDELFAGERAEMAKARAQRMATVLSANI